MNDINWRAVDLNLLVVFATLMEEQSVSKAANKLSVGQSAMSHSLSRLRELLQDPLFARQGHIMVPSKKAIELAPVINRILHQISHQVLLSSQFDAKNFEGMIKIGLTDYAEFLFAPSIFDALMAEAESCQICFFHVNKSNYQQIFNTHQLDLMIGSITNITSNFNHYRLYTEQHVCLFDKKTTGIDIPISMEDYLSVPHALANPIGQTTSFIDEQLLQQGLQRKVSITSTNFLTLRHLLIGRKLLCVVPELVAKMDVFSNALSYGEAPIKVADFDIEMLWEKRNDQHERSVWLRKVVKQVISLQVATQRSSAKELN